MQESLLTVTEGWVIHNNPAAKTAWESGQIFTFCLKSPQSQQDGEVSPGQSCGGLLELQRLRAGLLIGSLAKKSGEQGLPYCWRIGSTFRLLGKDLPVHLTERPSGTRSTCKFRLFILHRWAQRSSFQSLSPNKGGVGKFIASHFHNNSSSPRVG